MAYETIEPTELPFYPVKVTIGGEEFSCHTHDEYMAVMHEKVTKPVMEALAKLNEPRQRDAEASDANA